MDDSIYKIVVNSTDYNNNRHSLAILNDNDNGQCQLISNDIGHLDNWQMAPGYKDDLEWAANSGNWPELARILATSVYRIQEVIFYAKGYRKSFRLNQIKKEMK